MIKCICDLCGKEFEAGLMAGKATFKDKISIEKEPVLIKISMYTELTYPSTITKDICLRCLINSLDCAILRKS